MFKMFKSCRVVPVDEPHVFTRKYQAIYEEIIHTGIVKPKKDVPGIVKTIACLPICLPFGICCGSIMCCGWCVTCICGCNNIHNILGESIADGLEHCCDPCKDQNKLYVTELKRKRDAHWIFTNQGNFVISNMATLFNTALQERVSKSEFNSITYSLAEQLIDILILWSRCKRRSVTTLEAMKTQGIDYAFLDRMIHTYRNDEQDKSKITTY